MKFSIKDFFSKCDQISKKLQIWSYLLNKSLMENFIFCVIFVYGGDTEHWGDSLPRFEIFLIISNFLKF